MPAPSSFLAVALAPLLLAGGAAASLTVDWTIPADRRPYESLSASVGDSIRFDYDPGHNVVLHPTGTCDDAGGTYLGGTSPTEYAFDEAGTYTFACDVSDGVHCSLGQIITITVTDEGVPSDENADGGKEEPAVVDNGAGDDPGASVPAPPEEDPEEVLERFGEFFNEGEDRGLLEFRMKPYTIPSDVTTYVDFLFNIPEDLPGVVHIVAGDVINSQPKHLHHFVLTGCLEPVDPAKEGLPSYDVPDSCNIPLGGGWAVGGDFFGGISPDSGEVFGAALGIKAISLNVHYTDGQDVDLRYPNDGKNAIATDGFRMMYTTDLRPKTVVYRPLIDIGAGPGAMRVPPNDPRFFATKMCTVESACRDVSDEFMRSNGLLDFTCRGAKALCSPGNDELSASELMFVQNLCPVSCGLCDVDGAVSVVARSDGGGPDPDGWRVDSVFYHAHLLGREMYTTLLPNERSDVPIDLESKDVWLFDNQVNYPLSSGKTGESHLKVFPGDKIQASCVYDSTSREDPTFFGFSTYDEMCILQLRVVVDTPDVSADGVASMFTMINLKTFNCALDDYSDIWGGSLDGGEDARDIWKDHPMSEADCTFPVGAFDGALSLKGDASPNYQVRCNNFNICNGNEILDESSVAGDSCRGGTMDQADSNDYNEEGDGTFGEQCAAGGGLSVSYTCKQAEDYFRAVDFFDDETLERLRVLWYQPKCCTKGEHISICNGSDIFDGDAIAGENCNGGSMDGVDSNDSSGYDTNGDVTFEEQCIANGGTTAEYTCKNVEDFFFNGPLAAGYKPEELESIRVYQYQPKCCTKLEQDSPSSSDTTIDSADDNSGKSSSNTPGKVATSEASQGSGDDPDKEPSQGENGDAPNTDVASDGPDKATSGTFAKSPSLLFLLPAVACLLDNI